MTRGVAHPISWAVFDLGGVIIRIHRTWRDAAMAAGVQCRHDPSQLREQDFLRLVSKHQRGVLAHDAFCRGVSELTGGQVSADEVFRIHEAVILGAYPETDQIIAALRRGGVSTASLSNSNARHWENMREIPAFHALEHRHASHLFGLEKPDEKIFRAFEQATGAAGQGILYFDDLEENVRAARRAGWNAIHIDPHRETAPQIRAALARHGVRL